MKQRLVEYNKPTDKNVLYA